MNTSAGLFAPASGPGKLCTHYLPSRCARGLDDAAEPRFRHRTGVVSSTPRWTVRMGDDGALPAAVERHVLHRSHPVTVHKGVGDALAVRRPGERPRIE